MASPNLDLLRGMALFGGLPEQGLTSFAGLAERVTLAPGEVLFKEGDPAGAMYAIESGVVEVLKTNQDATISLVDLGAEDFFGEMGFVDMQARAGTVRAKTDVVLWRFPYIALRKLYCDDIKSYTLLVMNIARELSRRLRRADERIVQRAS